MSGRVALVMIALLVAGAGCQRVARTEAPGPTSVVVDHAEEARAAMAAQRWALAAEHLRSGLQNSPERLFLHYNLAICATWLDMRDEAVREFEWVVAHAPAGSEESKTASRWLADNRQPGQNALARASDGTNVGDGIVRGTLTWAETGPSLTPQPRLQLFLIGLRGTPTQGQRYMLRSNREGHYEFKDVVAGSYKLTDAIAARPRWRLKVTLDPGQNLSLDLTPQNGIAVRDDFPERS